jgi:cobalt-zinc-cadmium efflux system membrane fusion protein
MAEFKRAEANYNNLSRNFKAGSQQVSSPISGYINELLVKNGQFVNAGEPVMTISRNNRLIIQTELQSRYYDQLDNINSANFRILNSDKIFSLDKIAAGNILYSRSVDLNNPLITLTIQLDKGEDLLPGSMVDLYLKTDGNMSVITVPNESIVEEMGNYFVFVQQTPELFEKRPVLIGVNDGRRTEIKEGVLAGERVIAKGAVLVKLSQSAGAIDVHSGHVH